MTDEAYPVEVDRDPPFHDLSDVQVVFHGINKSGSLVMSNVLEDGFRRAGRLHECRIHYKIRVSHPEFVQAVDTGGHGLYVGHGLYGALNPRPRRIYITLLRHPLPRVVSCFSWMQAKHFKQNNTYDGFPSLDEFVKASSGTAHSQIVQFGIGYGARSGERKKSLSPKDILESCKDAIERDVYCLGISEYFEESIFLFAHVCNLKTIGPWAQDRRNKKRPLVDTIPPASIDLIREHYRYDFELYEWGLQRFRDQCSRIRFGSALKRYQDACKSQYKDRLLSS